MELTHEAAVARLNARAQVELAAIEGQHEAVVAHLLAAGKRGGAGSGGTATALRPAWLATLMEDTEVGEKAEEEESGMPFFVPALAVRRVRTPLIELRGVVDEVRCGCCSPRRVAPALCSVVALPSKRALCLQEPHNALSYVAPPSLHGRRTASTRSSASSTRMMRLPSSCATWC